MSLLLALRHPDAVKGLLLWHVTGGAVAAERLGYNYYEQFIEDAERDGMQGVVDSEFFAERIAETRPTARAAGYGRPGLHQRNAQVAGLLYGGQARDWRNGGGG